MAKKKQNIGFLTGLILAALFVVTAVLFVMVQYKVEALWGLVKGDFGGFKIAFGGDNSDGKFYFSLIFFFSIIAAAAAVLGALRILKINGRILFGVCALLALGSAIVYIAYYFDLRSSLKGQVLGQNFDFSKIVKWGFAFWAGFALQVLALLGSVFGIVKSNK